MVFFVSLVSSSLHSKRGRRSLPHSRSPPLPPSLVCKHITEGRWWGPLSLPPTPDTGGLCPRGPWRPAGTELLCPSLTPRNTGKSMRTHNCLLTATIAPFVSSLPRPALFLLLLRPVSSLRQACGLGPQGRGLEGSTLTPDKDSWANSWL